MSDTYTPGYSAAAAAFMTRRRLDPNGAFFLPHLKPGGMLGVCTPDWGGFLLAPPSEKLLVAFEAYKELQNRNGGDVYCGHKLGMVFEGAGFEGIVMRSHYENYAPLTVIGDFLAVNHEEAGDAKNAVTWREWGRRPGGMFSQAWVSCTGRKPATSSPGRVDTLLT